jgi:hypothetical protein
MPTLVFGAGKKMIFRIFGTVCLQVRVMPKHVNPNKNMITQYCDTQFVTCGCGWSMQNIRTEKLAIKYRSMHLKNCKGGVKNLSKPKTNFEKRFEGSNRDSKQLEHCKLLLFASTT